MSDDNDDGQEMVTKPFMFVTSMYNEALIKEDSN
jgi:hypothetical protein